MESHKQSTIMYAIGFVEDFLDNNTAPIEAAEEDQSDEKYMAHIKATNEQREQVRAMWAVLENGYKKLLAENGRLLNKIAMAELALKS